MANELNNALETLPEGIRPAFVGDSTSLEPTGERNCQETAVIFMVCILIRPRMVYCLEGMMESGIENANAIC